MAGLFLGHEKKALLVIALAATVSMASFTGCGMFSGQSATVATINDSITITKGEYDKAFDALLAQWPMADKEKTEALNDPVISELAKQKVFEQLIFKALLKAEAKKMDISVTDKDVKTFKEKQYEEIGGKENFKKALKQQGLTEAEFDDMLKEELLMERFAEVKAGDKLKVTDVELKELYKTHQAQFKMPEGIKAAHILLKVVERDVKKALVKDNPKITSKEVAERIATIKKQKKDQAEKLLASLQKKPDTFKDVATKRSEDRYSAAYGGDLGFMPKSKLDPDFWHAAVDTKPGTIHPEVVKTQFGYHIIKLNEYQPAHTKTFDEAKGDLTQYLQAARKQEEVFKWLMETRKDAKVEFAKGYKPETDEVKKTLKTNEASEGKAAETTVEPTNVSAADKKS